MGKNNKIRRKGKKRKKNKKTMQAKTLRLRKKYTLCLAEYYVPGTSPESIVRMTASVTDVQNGRDETVETLEYWANEDDLDAAIDDIFALAEKYDTEIMHLNEAVPLEECPCGCDGYLVNRITSQDLVRQYRAN